MASDSGQENIKIRIPYWVIYLSVGMISIVLILLGWRYLKPASPSISEFSIKPVFNVRIQFPPTNYQSLVGAQIPIQVLAELNNTELSAAELWINGVPVALQADINGTNPVEQVDFTWIPAQAGQYSVAVFFIGANGFNALTEPISLIVSDESQTEVEEVKISDPVSLVAYSNYVGVTPPIDIPIILAQPWQLPSANVNSPPLDSLPTAPQLAVTVNQCQAVLSIQDQSNNEAGFRIYRQLGNANTWSLVSVIAPNPDTGWLEYADSDLVGAITYKVAAFNQVGQTDSNPGFVTISPQDCAPPAPNSIHIFLTELTVNKPVEEAYCYTSLEGEVWQRWPKTGMIPLVDGELSEAELSPLMTLLQQNTDDLIETGNTQLFMDCWGWQNSALVNIGSLDVDLSPYLVTEGQIDVGPDVLGLSAKLGIEMFDPTISLDQFPKLNPIPFEIDYSPYLLVPNSTSTDNLNLCEAFFELSDLNLPENYCVVGDSDTPFKYVSERLIWATYSKTSCALGQSCIVPYELGPYSDVTAIAEGEFGYNIYAEKNHFWGLLRSFPSPLQFVYLPPGWIAPHSGQNCENEEINYRIHSYFIPAGSDKMYESAGNIISVPAPCPTVDTLLLRIDLESLNIGAFEEEPDEGETLDMYGYFWVNADQGSGDGLAFAINEPYPEECQTIDAPDLNDAGLYDGLCPVSGVPTQYALNNFWLCNTPGWVYPCNDAPKFENNTMWLSVIDGYGGSVQFNIIDHDINSSDDLICFGSVYLPQQPIAAWGGVLEETYFFEAFSDTDSTNSVGTCKLTVRITPHNLYEAP